MVVLENIDIDIDIDKKYLRNIDIDIDIDKEILKISIFKEDLNKTSFLRRCCPVRGPGLTARHCRLNIFHLLLELTN